MKKLDLLQLLNNYQTITLVRHLDSLQNAMYRNDEDVDQQRVKELANRNVPLSKRGFTEGLKLAPAFSHHYRHTDSVVHSGYKRTHETWEVLSSKMEPDDKAQINEYYCPFLAERDDGFVYRMEREDITEHYPFYNFYKEIEGRFFERPPGGESVFDVSIGRAYNFFTLLKNYPFGNRVVIVAHSGFIRAFRFLVENWTYEEAEDSFEKDIIPNGSITEYRNVDGRMVLDSVNRNLSI